MATPAPKTQLAFGRYVLDRPAGRLLRDGVPVALAPRPYALLCHLAERAGQLVSKDELLLAVWDGEPLGDGVLKTTVNLVRKALHDDSPGPATAGDDGTAWVQTVPRRGYRFAGEVRVLAPGAWPTAVPAAGGPDADLYGRERDVQRLLQGLGTHRLVTVTGVAGIGKTRLAEAVAPRVAAAFPDGVAWVRLDGLGQPEGLVDAVGAALTLPAQAARDAASLAAAARGRRALLVLDNCEHLLDAVAGLVATLLDGEGALRVLATSQQPLALRAEQVLPLAPLALPPAGDERDGLRYAAVALFVQRVSTRQPDFVFDDHNAAAVCALCAALDALPLAIELAAARVPLLGVDGVRERLGDRLALLTRGPRDLSPRHRTLRSALDWSHQLLSPQAQAVLRRVSVFAGSFSVVAAREVVADETLSGADVVEALDLLREKSLLMAEPGAPGRLRTYDSVRSYAAEALRAAGEHARTAAAHAHAMLAWLRAADATAHDRPWLEWVVPLAPDIDNLRQAMQHALATPALHGLAVALAAHAVDVMRALGLVLEAWRWHRAVAAWAGVGLPPEVQAARARATVQFCTYEKLGAPAEALAALEGTLGVYRTRGDTFGEYYALFLQSHLMLRLRPEADRGALLTRMAALEQPGWSVLRRRYGRSARAYWLRSLGDTEGFRQGLRDEVALLRAAGDRQGLWVALHGLALAEHDLGRVDEAIALLESTLEDLRQAGQDATLAQVLALLASMHLEQGCTEAGMPRLQRAAALLRSQGALWWIAPALPWGPLACGRHADAARVQGWADATIERLGEQAGPFFARVRQRCVRQLSAMLGAPRYAVLHAQGAALDEGVALALALEPPVKHLKHPPPGSHGAG